MATASDWIVPGNIISSAINESKKEVSYVRLLSPKEIGTVVREGMKENPIDVCDSDEEDLKCDEKFSVDKEVKDPDVYSVDGMDVMLDASDFDADALLADTLDVFEPIHNDESQMLNKPTQGVGKSKGWTQVDAIIDAKSDEKTPDLNVSLRLNSTDQLRKSKRRMENCFMDDYSIKMKSFKRAERSDYEGEYMFIVRLGEDDNTVEIKDTVTMCKITKVEDESHESEDV